MDLSKAYIWLDKIKLDLLEDHANPQRIEAVQTAQIIIREKITGETE